MNKLLIGTSRSLLLWDKKHLRQITSGNGIYYGITWSKKMLYVAARNWIQKVTKDEKKKDTELIQIWNPNFKYTATIRNELFDDLHQILYHDECLYITNTGHDRIECFDGEHIRKFNYTGMDENTRHINSLWIDEKDLLYVGEHGREFGGRIKVFNLDFELIETYEKTGQHSHNVYVEDNVLYYMNSYNHSFIQRDLSTGKEEKIKLGGFTRGLARTENLWYVGVSHPAKRNNRHHKVDATIYIFNNNLDLVQSLKLPSIGQLNEIRVIDEIDKAHNRLPYPIDLNIVNL